MKLQVTWDCRQKQFHCDSTIKVRHVSVVSVYFPSATADYTC